MVENKILYSYSTLVKNENLHKTLKKERTVTVADDDDDMDYKLSSKHNIRSVLSNTKIDRSIPETKKNTQTNL